MLKPPLAFILTLLLSVSVGCTAFAGIRRSPEPASSPVSSSTALPAPSSAPSSTAPPTPQTPPRAAPQISVSPAVFDPGAILTIRGIGFDPSAPVLIHFDDQPGPSFRGPPVGRAQSSAAGEFTLDVVIPPYQPGSTVEVFSWPQRTGISLPPLGSASPASCSDFFRLPTVIYSYPPVVTTRSNPHNRNEPIQIFVGGLQNAGVPMTVRARPILSGEEFQVVFQPSPREGTGRSLKDGTMIVGFDIPDRPDWIGKCLWLDLDFADGAYPTWAFVDFRR